MMQLDGDGHDDSVSSYPKALKGCCQGALVYVHGTWCEHFLHATLVTDVTERTHNLKHPAQVQEWFWAP